MKKWCDILEIVWIMLFVHCLTFIAEKKLLSESDILNLAINTLQQSNSKDWFAEIFLRISESKKATLFRLLQ